MKQDETTKVFLQNVFLLKRHPKFGLVYSMLAILLLLTGCVGIMFEKNSWLPEEMDGVNDFLKVFLVLEVSIFLFALPLNFIVGQASITISTIIHWIWIVYNREYGIFMVIALFGFSYFISYVINWVWIFWKKSR